MTEDDTHGADGRVLDPGRLADHLRQCGWPHPHRQRGGRALLPRLLEQAFHALQYHP